MLLSLSSMSSRLATKLCRPVVARVARPWKLSHDLLFGGRGVRSRRCEHALDTTAFGPALFEVFHPNGWALRFELGTKLLTFAPILRGCFHTCEIGVASLMADFPLRSKDSGVNVTHRLLFVEAELQVDGISLRNWTLKNLGG